MAKAIAVRNTSFFAENNRPRRGMCDTMDSFFLDAVNSAISVMIYYQNIFLLINKFFCDVVLGVCLVYIYVMNTLVNKQKYARATP